jgi:DNA polymerase I-like protein with 3'-5' exonuclease and polymerase domains
MKQKNNLDAGGTIISDSDLPQFLVHPEPERYLRDDYVILDFETTTHGKGLAIYAANRCVSVAWRLGRDHPGYRDGRRVGEIRYLRASEFELEPLIEAVRGASFIVAHNAKFDLQWLARAGLDLANVLVYDTLLGEYVLGGNRWLFSQLSLDAISKRRFGTAKVDLIAKMWEFGIDTQDIPEEWLERYCVQDVRLTETLFLAQRQDLNNLGLLPVLYNRCLLTPILADIERNGVQLDENLVRTKIEEVEHTFVGLERQLTEFTGGINFNSGPQVGAFLYDTLGFAERSKRVGGRWVPDRTPPSRAHPQGQRKTDADTILALKATTAKQAQFVSLYTAYKEKYYELTKYLRKMLDCCNEANGHLLASFNQSSTQTHRLSSTGLAYSLQFQNFPRAYKYVFKARTPGWLVGECDGAQLEFRDAVHLGRDKVGLADIVNDVDIHNVTASVIWQDIEWDGTGKHPMRQEAKPHTFKPTYGGKSGTEDEKRYYEFFRKKYYGITQWQNDNIDFVLNNKYLETEWGLRYYWPDTSMDRSGYVRNSTSICNYPVQAQATAEMIPMAIVWFWHRLKRSTLKMFIVNTVHDSIVVELPPEEKEAFHELSRQCLIDDVYRTMSSLYGVRLTVPLGCGVSVGTHWGSKDETKYSAPEALWIDAAKEAGMI